MKLLFDQNLSPRLVELLADAFPGSQHVLNVGLERADDFGIWTYARSGDFIIVTNDSDFCDISVVEGFPPKVVWLRMGNARTRQIEGALRRQMSAIQALADNPEMGILALY